MVHVAQVFVFSVAVYVGIGLFFASAFVTTGVGRIDPSAAHAPIGFRLIIIPGAVALWPLLAVRWLRGQQPTSEATPHRFAASRRASVAARSEVPS